MRKCLLVISLFIFPLLGGCSSQSSNLEGKLYDANSNYCRMLSQQGSSLQTSSYNDGTLNYGLLNVPDAPRPVVEPAEFNTNRQELYYSHNQLCESKAAYNKRTKLNLEI